MSISVIIPIGPKETRWECLLDRLHFLTGEDECILVCAAHEEQLKIQKKISLLTHSNFRSLSSPVGRAKQLNLGAQNANREFLWFLHSDTKVERDHYTQVLIAAKNHPDAIHYFHLGFYAEGAIPSLPRHSLLMKINECGVYLRCILLGMPFGDQAFFMRKKVFNQIGGFNEDASYGEDHLLIWQAKHLKKTIRSLGPKILTSSKKYLQQGWLKTTFTHLYLTYKQALPEFITLLFLKIKR